MQIFEIILISISLAMDAFAVAMCRGLEMKKFNPKYATIIALTFGGFQALMPLIGWIVGKQFESYITSFDHYIAFILLAIIGGKMVYDSTKKDECSNLITEKLDIKQLLIMAIATSIDALAVGVTFAFLQTNIAVAVSLIGLITFALSFLGVYLGSIFGVKYKKKAELFGGIVLILMGLKILLSHLGVLPF